MWYIAKSIRHHFQKPAAIISPHPAGAVCKCKVNILKEEQKKQNAFSQSSFYFLHQHFKTAPQISWRRGDMEGYLLAQTWVWQGDGGSLCAHTHTYLQTQLAYLQYRSAYGSSTWRIPITSLCKRIF